MFTCQHVCGNPFIRARVNDILGPPETMYTAETKMIGLAVRISHKPPVFLHPCPLTTPLKGIRRMTYKSKYYKSWPKTTMFLPLNPNVKKDMKTLTLAVGSLLLFTGLALGRVTCEAASSHQIGWCMDPGNEQDREDCPIEYHDWDTPVDGECPSEDVNTPFGAYC